MENKQTTKRKGKTLTGKVVSLKMNKTIAVEVTQLTRHPLYRKTMRSTKKYLAHYEGNSIQLGDIITIAETRPMSKNKRFIAQEGKGK